MSAKKILFLVGDFAEDYEVMVPFQALTMLGLIGIFGIAPVDLKLVDPSKPGWRQV